MAPGGLIRRVRQQPRRAVGRVLLAEDNRVNREVVAGMLTVLGVDAETVGNGREAVDAWRSGRFDLVLMDCQMPEMDGYEATRSIRAEEERVTPGGRRTPIVALTAHALAGDRELSLAAGMDDHLSKPFRMHQLEAVIERWLRPGAEQRLAGADAQQMTAPSARRRDAGRLTPRRDPG